MTLCIAAICNHQQQPAIVLCSDWRSESGDVAGGDVEDKLSWIVDNKLAALKAGTISDADKMTTVIRSVFQELQVPITGETILPLLDRAMNRYRCTVIDDYLGATVGIDYVSLVGGIRTPGKDEPVMLPDEFLNKLLNDIERVPVPPCQLIVAGFSEDAMPFICVLNEPSDGSSYSRTRFEKNFAAIGSGSPAALISLYRREHTATDVNLMKAIYNVYEAKLIGEVSPGVGDATAISVLLPGGRVWDLTTEGHKYIGERYDYFGPLRFGRKRPVVKAPYFQFKTDFFEPYEQTWGRTTGRPISPESNPPE